MEYYKHRSDEYSCRERAIEHLKRFDEGDHTSLFYAALDLRYSIEARLWTYIAQAYKDTGAEIPKEYSASKLLRKLSCLKPEYEKECNISLSSSPDGPCATLAFTPVTRKLAGYHGKLGFLLHHTFFKENPSWYLNTSLTNGFLNLGDYRSFLSDVLNELNYSLSGSLLGHPTFSGLIKEEMAE